jgi:hypothetical protein
LNPFVAIIGGAKVKSRYIVFFLVSGNWDLALSG